MRVFVDGEPVEVPEGATVRDALEEAGVEVPDDVVIALFKGEEETERETDRIRVTIREIGTITLAVEDDRFRTACEQLPGTRVTWTTRDEVALGPIDVSDIDYRTRRGLELPPYTAIVVLPTNDPTEAYLLLTRRRMAVEYVCTDLRGRVTAGRELVDRLQGGEEVEDLEPVVERVTRQVLSKATPNTRLEEDDHLFTRVVIELSERSPDSAELLLATLDANDGRLEVKMKTDTFTAVKTRPFYELSREEIGPRDRGVVTVRHEGRNEGTVYFYRRDRVPVESHNVVGRVKRGLELIDVATEGDRILVETIPERVNLVGLTLEEARELAEEHGFELEIEGEGDVVVEQEPRETLRVLEEGRAKVRVVPSEEVIDVELYEDRAPKSVEYFRRVAGMLDRPVGKLKVHFAYADLGMVVFEGDEKEGKGLPPENTPEEVVKPGDLGVTNQVKPHAGLIGVRLEESREYGPTGETFEGTNLIGRVVRGLERLAELDQSDMGKTVYVREVTDRR